MSKFRARHSYWNRGETIHIRWYSEATAAGGPFWFFDLCVLAYMYSGYSMGRFPEQSVPASRALAVRAGDGRCGPRGRGLRAVRGYAGAASAAGAGARVPARCGVHVGVESEYAC